MQLTIVNLTGSTKTYLSEAISVAGNSSTTVSSNAQKLSLSTDGQLRLDIFANIVQISDGTNTYAANDAIDYLKLIPLASSVPLADYSGNGITSTAVGSQRALDVNLASSVTQKVNIADSNQLDAHGRIRVSDTDLIESLHFSNSGHPLLISTLATGSGTAAFNASSSSLRLSLTTSSSDSIIAQTKRYFRYNPGRSYLVTISGNVGVKKNNVRQRFGYFDINNGLFFQQDGSNLSVVIRTNSSGSPVDTVINQSNWNLDKLDGTGASGINLDTTKHNLYVIDFLWHGAGRIRYGIFYNGQIVYCHQINSANTSSVPYMRTPSLPLRAELTNTGTAASGTTLDLVCFAFQKEASDDLVAPYLFTASTGITSENVASTLIPILCIRPKTTFNGLTNRIPIIPNSLNVMTNQQPIYVQVLLNPTLTGASFNSVNANSAVEFDFAATAVSGGLIIKEFYVAAQTGLLSSTDVSISTSFDLITLGLDIAASVQDVLVIAAKSTAGGSSTWAQMDWEEFQ